MTKRSSQISSKEDHNQARSCLSIRVGCSAFIPALHFHLDFRIPFFASTSSWRSASGGQVAHQAVNSDRVVAMAMLCRGMRVE
jgi:hypothetical protein